MRRYQAIWNQLKKHKVAKVVAPANLHARIIKAVKKEKWLDTGFKLISSELDITYQLAHSINEDKTVITFTLEDVSGIKLSDL